MSKSECHMVWEIVTTSPVQLEKALRDLPCIIRAKWTKGSWKDVQSNVVNGQDQSEVSSRKARGPGGEE